jgi:gamma-glutamyltranspeptidase/glutathione hydrolase
VAPLRTRYAAALLVAIGLGGGCARAAAAAPVPAPKPAAARDAIASAHPLASEAGHEVLQAGGNAFDAAVAVAAALAVVEPSGSGLGGGGFLLLHRASDGVDVMIDAREKAPAASTRDMYLDAAGNPVPGLSVKGGLSAGIPGEPAGLGLLAQKYGRLPLARSLAPAIRLAREGFPLYERLRSGLRIRLEILRAQPEAARHWLVHGEIPPLGYIVKQPELAKTLELIARHGTGYFYQGPLAEQLVAGVHAQGGIWSAADLAGYAPVERPPIVGSYHGARIVSGSPPTSGGILLVEALNVLAGYDLEAMDPVTRIHVIVEAMRRMHRDRAVWLGDPDYVRMPVEQLIHPDYAAGLRASISLEQATPSALLPGKAPDPAGTDTTHFSILDRDGNRVAATLTLNFWLGSGLEVPGTGVFLNDEMDDFSIKPGVPNGYGLVGSEANAIAPGKRPLSSSTPTFVEAPGGLLILGTPGGSYIPGAVLLGVLDYLRGRTAEQIVSAPRFHHQYLPDVLQYEPDAFTAEERKSLEARGYALSEDRGRWGNLQVVTWDYATHQVQAASDPRGAGEGRVY